MSLVEQALVEEIKQKINTASVLRNKINEAKTTLKQNYYRKKLTKNNNETASLLQALQKLQDKKEQGVVNESDNRS